MLIISAVAIDFAIIKNGVARILDLSVTLTRRIFPEQQWRKTIHWQFQIVDLALNFLDAAINDFFVTIVADLKRQHTTE